MEKPIIATTLSGLFLKSDPWDKAHELWFEERAEELNDKSILKWVGREDYFKGVDEVMKKLYPKFSDEKRTKRARELFFEAVIKYIEINPGVRNLEIIRYFDSLKDKFRVALITTNTNEATQKILSTIGLVDFFDIVETSRVEEKDDKRAVFDRFIKKYGKPLLYIGGGRKDSYDYCAEYNINRIFANFEGGDEITGVKSVHSLEELKQTIGK